MKRFLFITLLAVLLTACATPTPSPTMTPSATVSPSEVMVTSIPDVALTATPTDVAVMVTPDRQQLVGDPTPLISKEGYASQLDITFESPEQVLRYNGATITGKVNVDNSAASHGIHEMTMTPDLQAKLSMRALHNIFLPDEDDNDANLAAFTKKLAAIQTGNGSCADFARTISMYDANGSGEPTEMTIVPACGASSVPDGAVEVKSINFVTGSWYVWSEELGKNVANPDFPWYDVVIAGGGGGVLFDSITGELKVMNGLSFLDRAGENGTTQVASVFEITLDYLKHFFVGKSFKLTSAQRYENRAITWQNGLQIK